MTIVLRRLQSAAEIRENFVYTGDISESFSDDPALRLLQELEASDYKLLQ
jgi:hypothetical protein